MYKFDIGEDSVEVLDKSEFELLDKNAKEEYINGRLHLDEDGISWIEKVIRSEDNGDSLMDEIWDKCVERLYPFTHAQIELKQPDNKDAQLDEIYGYIDELEDEDWNDTRIFLVDKVYSSENLYELIIEKAKEASKDDQIIITKEQRKSASDLCLQYVNESSNHINKLAIIALALGVEFGINDEKINEIVKGEKSINVYLIWFITVLWNQDGSASEDEMVKPFIELKSELRNDMKALAENIDWTTIERLWNGCLTKFGIALKD